MIRVMVSGYGKMGSLVKQKLETTDGMECAGVLDPALKDPEKAAARPEELTPFDVIVDFSHPDNLPIIGEYAKKNQVALVIATTGFSDDQICYIETLSQCIPVVYTANCSLGVTVLAKVLSEVAAVLADTFDIEVVEKHHNLKLDSPSGTAKMLVNAMDPEGEFARVYGRSGNGRRGREIGIHALRGGSIVGEHTVLFAGEDEVLEFTHKATSKQIFANGAVKAARFVAGQAPGLYTMNDVLFHRAGEKETR